MLVKQNVNLKNFIATLNCCVNVHNMCIEHPSSLHTLYLVYTFIKSEDLFSPFYSQNIHYFTSSGTFISTNIIFWYLLTTLPLLDMIQLFYLFCCSRIFLVYLRIVTRNELWQSFCPFAMCSICIPTIFAIPCNLYKLYSTCFNIWTATHHL